LLDRGANIKKHIDQAYTKAAYMGQLNILSMLSKLYPGSANNKYDAMQRGLTQNEPEVVKFFVESGMDLNMYQKKHSLNINFDSRNILTFLYLLKKGISI
jgi:hypothetical protein